jgi:hypothetical protein
VHHCVCSLAFAWIGLTAAHHAPETWHEGDAQLFDSEQVTDKDGTTDWGVFQVDAVRDRTETKNSLILALMWYGDHTLHHLFPTIDLAKLQLPAVQKALRQTQTEFDVLLPILSLQDLIVGKYKQLNRQECHSKEQRQKMTFR